MEKDRERDHAEDCICGDCVAWREIESTNTMTQPTTPATRPMEGTELCWETDVADSPPELWRAYSFREFKGKRVRHVNWFATEEAAEKHAAWIADGRGEVIGVSRYCLMTRTKGAR